MAAPVLSSFAVTAPVSGATISITAPSGIVSGDLVIVYVESNTTAVTWTAPDGTWTQRSSSNTGAVFTKTSSGSEPSSWSFSRSLSLNNAGGHAVRVTSPGAYSDSAVVTRAAYTSMALPSVTASTPNSLLVQFIYDMGGAGSPFTAPAGVTKVYDNTVGGAIGHQTVSNGATGTRTWTFTASSNAGGALIAIGDATQSTIQRAGVLYPVNTTTVDTGTGIDVRLLDSAEAGADDSTQTASFTHTDDNIERTFDPATAGVTNTNNAGTTLFKTGWALRLAQDMTPSDDAVCDAMLTAGTLTVSLQVNANQSGGTYASGTYSPTFRASLWKYNLSADTGSLIAAGTTTATTWAVGSLNVAKTATISIDIPTAVTFSTGGTAAEVLLLQVGFNTGTVPNPTLGTANWVQTLTVDNTNTKITFASGQGIRQMCTYSLNTSGVGTVTRSGVQIATTKNTIGVGTSTYARATIASKTFSLSGNGTPSYTKFTSAYRNFSLQGTGRIPTTGTNASTVVMPIDKVPTGSGGGTTTNYFFPVLD